MTAGDTVPVEIRPLYREWEIGACLELQRHTWGEETPELVSPAMLRIAQKLGGVAAGAFTTDDSLVGFVYGLTGVRDGRLVHWSHMLAVPEELRSRGIGRQLKQYQREQVLGVGVELMLWTFDPLVALNAHLNLNVLGVLVVEYVEDMYGAREDTTTDRIIGSDRFVVEWPLRDPLPASAGIAADIPTVDLTVAHLPAVPIVAVEVPEDVQVLKLTAPEEARAWRAATRRAFLHYLSRGYRVDGFTRRDGRCRYRLSREGPR